MGEINIDPGKLTGMSAGEAKDYILSYITTLKLTEKEINALMEEAEKWKGRSDLARSKGMDELLAEAEKECEKINIRLEALLAEKRTLEENIASMRRQLPGLAARERSIDPDILEQELLMALGKTAEEISQDKAFRDLEKEAAAGSALDALKAKMKEGDPS